MIYEVEGDLLLSRAQVLVQGVASGDPMNRGFARKLHEKYPGMVTAYNAWCEEAGPEPGQIWLWNESDKATIANLVTHDGSDDPAHAGHPDKIAINRCFRALAHMATEQRFKSIAMPKIGVGPHGLDWREVLGMMDSQLGTLLIPIFVYTVDLDGQVGSEPGL